MPLSNELRDVPIEFKCPSCSCPMVRRGSWLKTIAGFNCGSCRSRVRIGYEEKLAIFERHLKRRAPDLGRRPMECDPGNDS